MSTTECRPVGGVGLGLVGVDRCPGGDQVLVVEERPAERRLEEAVGDHVVRARRRRAGTGRSAAAWCRSGPSSGRPRRCRSRTGPAGRRRSGTAPGRSGAPGHGCSRRAARLPLSTPFGAKTPGAGQVVSGRADVVVDRERPVAEVAARRRARGSVHVTGSGGDVRLTSSCGRHGTACRPGAPGWCAGCRVRRPVDAGRRPGPSRRRGCRSCGSPRRSPRGACTGRRRRAPVVMGGGRGHPARAAAAGTVATASRAAAAVVSTGRTAVRRRTRPPSVVPSPGTGMRTKRHLPPPRGGVGRTVAGRDGRG